MLRSCQQTEGIQLRDIQVKEITEAVRDMCIQINHSLSQDMCRVFQKAVNEEKSELGKQVLSQLQENLEIAETDRIPICQDTGMAVILQKWARKFI